MEATCLSGLIKCRSKLHLYRKGYVLVQVPFTRWRALRARESDAPKFCLPEQAGLS